MFLGSDLKKWACIYKTGLFHLSFFFSVKTLQPFEMYFHWLKTFNYVHILELKYVEIFIVLFPVSSF